MGYEVAGLSQVDFSLARTWAEGGIGVAARLGKVDERPVELFGEADLGVSLSGQRRTSYGGRVGVRLVF